MSAPGEIVVVSIETLRAIIREEVAIALDSSRAAPSEYTSRQEEAKRLNISLATLDRLCRDGRIPFVVVGDSRRFRPSETDQALRAGRAAEGGESCS